MNFAAPRSVTDRFVLILEGIYAAVAARYRSPEWTNPLLWAVCNRIRRVEHRVQKLLALFLAGALAPEAAVPRRSRAGEKRVFNEDAVRQPGVGVRVPRGFGWLIRMVPYTAAGYACQLRLNLAEPEMVALLAASAKARRALAPLLRMLMIEPEVLAPKPAEETSAPPEGERDISGEAGVSGPERQSVASEKVRIQAELHPARGAQQAQGPPLI